MTDTVDTETAEPAQETTSKSWTRFFAWKYVKWVVLAGLFVFVAMCIFALTFYLRATRDLPSIETLSEYRPAVMTRVHAGDGRLIAEYAKEHRVFVPIETIPKDLQHAFVAAEDQRFYQHDGFDERGFARAMIANVGHKLRGERLEGGSTLTQQVAKNFLVGSERSVERKLREIVIARRIEKAMDKDHILELYLNEIYFGRRAYGIAAASLNYFGKPMKDLTLEEAAYLAVLPKAPNNYNPETNKERALNRRNYVLSRMVEDGYVTEAEAEAARETDLVVTDRLTGEDYLAAEYFVEETRKQIFSMFGEDELYEGGLSIRTTLDTRLQTAAWKALREGLEAHDRRNGYRGPVGHFDSFEDWKTRLDAYEAPPDIGDWTLALVMETTDAAAQIELQFDEDAIEVGEGEELPERPETGTLPLENAKWARAVLDNGRYGTAPQSMSDIVEPGDLILVERTEADGNVYALRQVPGVNGGLVAMDPHTGRVLALVGGYSFRQNQFNRVTQAYRQPGSAFKPFVYAAALQNGFTPASQVLDAPFVVDLGEEHCAGRENDPECERFYKPSNYAAGRFYGMSTLRLGLEKSRNAMTVRLANDIGMAPIMDISRRFGIYDDPQPQLAWSLGAGETTLLKLANAYSMLVNGGKDISPTILDRVQNGTGETIFVHGEDNCPECRVEEWDGQEPPERPDEREVVLDPVTAYQIVYMLKGVVDAGTGRTIASLGRPLGGKTGTTNDYMDAWFMGFSPDLVAGVYVGYDTPQPLNGEAGATAAAPIFKAFMKEALEGEPLVPFRIPEGVKLSPVDRSTGVPSYIGAPNFILEAFKPGTEPGLGQSSRTISIGGGTDGFIRGVSDDAIQNENTDERDIDNTGPQPSETEDQDENVFEDGLY